MPPCRCASAATGSRRRAELVPRARTLVDAGDIVLVKGSKGIKVTLVVDALRKLGQAVALESKGTD